MTTITQDMRFRLSLIRYADKHGVSKAARVYKTNRQYIYRWKRRYDGSWDSLRDRSRREDLTLIPLSIRSRKFSSSATCAEETRMPGSSSFG